MIKCPECNGKGKKEYIPIFVTPSEGKTIKEVVEKNDNWNFSCPLCEGVGLVTEKVKKWHDDGQKLKERRRGLKIGPHRAANILGVPTIVLFEMENGRRKPESKLYDLLEEKTKHAF